MIRLKTSDLAELSSVTLHTRLRFLSVADI